MQHTVSISKITDGDHIYIRSGLGFTMSKQGIVVPPEDRTGSERWMVITNDAARTDGNLFPQLRRIALDEFRDSKLKLRRVRYDQVDAVSHHIKLPGTSYAETRVPIEAILYNAVILYQLSQSPDVFGDQLKLLLGNQYEHFPYICSTTYAKNWTLLLDSHSGYVQSFSNSVPDSYSISEKGQDPSTEIDSSSRKYDWSHAVEISDLRRGDHIYSWRKGLMYQHHAIVIARSDVPEGYHRTHPIPIIEDLMVIENNKTESPCIRIVTLAHFAGNYRIRRVQYSRNGRTDMFVIDIKLRGKVYLQDSLPADDVIKNALYLYRRSSPTNRPQVENYDFFFHNCEQFAFACSTDKTMISRCEEQNESPDYRSQQWQATCNLASHTAITTAWHTLERTDAWKYLVEKLLPSMKGFSRPILRTMVQGGSFRQSLQSFIRVAGPVVGIVAAITCFIEIGLLTIRHFIYLLTDGLERIKVLALGLALELAKFVKGVIQAIVSNGLSAIFSLIGGALGLLVPIPCVNFLLSVAFGIAGLSLGRYLASIPVNLYQRHKYLKEREQEDTE
ncbi:hypothetical protein I4U23_027752 [Adineta vaga]|nr:hypothetical protein I4U23_027752 [Adineta vaga]